MTPGKHPVSGISAHQLVADTAKGIAAEIYEQFAKASNEFYAENPDQTAYVEKSWGLYCEAARATLASMLSGSYPDVLKNEIHEALLLDNPLRLSRENLQVAPN